MPATDFTICAVPGQVGEGIFANTLAVVSRKDIDVTDDGRFTIELDASASGGRRNHLSITGAKVLLVCDSMADWSRELLAELVIERIDEPMVADHRCEEGFV